MIGINKKSSLTNLLTNNTKQYQLNDQSFAESTISKRFSRRKNTEAQSNKQLNHTKTLSINTQKQQYTKEEQRPSQNLDQTLKVEDFYIKIAHTPTKIKKYYAPLSSDRTESTDMRQKHQTELMIGGLGGFEKNLISQLKQQLIAKNDQIMFLQDENMKMKRDLSAKEQEFIQSNICRQKEYEKEFTKLKEQIKILNTKLDQKDKVMKVIISASNELSCEVKTLKMDKMILQKQLDQVYKKKLTKDLKELMSFREISIMKELQQLKQKIHQSKTEYELALEAQLEKLKQENQIKISQIKNLQIHNRILNRKIDEYEKSLKENIEQFSRSYNNIKEQLKKIRKQNVKLRRLHILNLPHSIKKLDLYESSQQSLSLSLSSGQ